jgi:hypothetical protein
MHMKTKMATVTDGSRRDRPRNSQGGRKLSGAEIGSLAKRMVESNDPHEKAALKEAIVSGFYGEESDA